MKRSAHRTRKLILIVADLLLLYLSLYLALALRYQGASATERFFEHLTPFTFAFCIWLLIFYSAGLYEYRPARRMYAFYAASVKALSSALVAAVMLFYLVPSFGIAPKTNLLLTGLIFYVLFVIWRVIWDKASKSQRLLHPIICVGANKEMRDIIEMITRQPDLGYTIAAVVEHKDDLERLSEIVMEHKADTVVYARHAFPEDISKALYALVPLSISIVDLATFFSHITRKVPVSIIGEAWFLENLIEREKSMYEIEKRLFDGLAAFVGIIFTLPLLPFIAIAIQLDSPGPVFYTQSRVGKNGRNFRLLKFRTMVKDAEARGTQWTAPHDTRITRVGKLIRKTRIDELPQLWNILIGDMSFIGPRPERPEFVERLEKEVPHYRMRLLVRPGLTGWAQIHEPLHGASTTDTLEKLQYDLYYVKRRGLFMDLDIVLRTIPVILGREGH